MITVVIASVTDRQITSGLAIQTLKKALASQPQIKEKLILHSDQGSQYTSKAFVKFCESVHVSQSMGKAGCPYDIVLFGSEDCRQRIAEIHGSGFLPFCRPYLGFVPCPVVANTAAYIIFILLSA